jgi:hypothetical protein
MGKECIVPEAQASQRRLGGKLPSPISTSRLRTFPAGKGGGLIQSCLAEILVDRFPADSVIAGKDDFRDAATGAPDQFCRPFRRQGLLSPLVGATLIGQGDAFALAFPDQRPLEFSEGAITKA